MSSFVNIPYLYVYKVNIMNPPHLRGISLSASCSV
nr:MAG TPA: hypothetical protein [Caudoviricetes sp.]